MRPGARGVALCSDHPCQALVRLRTWDAAALGHRLARDLLDVGRERDRGRGADRHADAVGVDRTLGRLELADAVGVEPARDEDPDVVEPGLVEPRPHLLHQVPGHAAAPARRAYAHAAQPLAASLADAERR